MWSEAQYRHGAELDRKRRDEYHRRLQAVGLSLKDRDFNSSAYPTSIKGWELHRTLLEREGNLTPTALKEIEGKIEFIKILDKAHEIEQRLHAGQAVPASLHDLPLEKLVSTGAGRNLIIWSAVEELGLDKNPKYNYLKENAGFGARCLTRPEETLESIYISGRPLD